MALLSNLFVLIYKIVQNKRLAKSFGLQKKESISQELIFDLLNDSTYQTYIRISHESEKSNSPISQKSYDEFMQQGQLEFINQNIFLNDNLLERRHFHV